MMNNDTTYKLYFIPGACSLATQAVLRELNQEFEIIARDEEENFSELNPVGTVPVLVDDNEVLVEGAALMLYLLDKHPNNLLPKEGQERLRGIENILFANATMHPAYGRLFFISQNISNEEAQTEAYEAAAKAINALWEVVEHKLTDQNFLGGTQPSAADYMLAVYQRWGAHFPVSIKLGSRAQKMIDSVHATKSFKDSVIAENETVAQ